MDAVFENQAGSSSENAPYKRMLKVFHDELPKAEVESMKFFCSDVIPAGRLEEINNALHLFIELESMGTIGPSNLFFLAELLYRIGRRDLLNKMKWNIADLESQLQQSLTDRKSYRLLLFKVSEDLTKKELEELKFTVSDHLPRSTVQDIKSTEGLILALERKDILSINDFRCLEELLHGARKRNLIRLIAEFKEKMASTPRPDILASERNYIRHTNSELVPSAVVSREITDPNNMTFTQLGLNINARTNGEPILPSLPNHVVSDREAQPIDTSVQSGASNSDSSQNLAVRSCMRETDSGAAAKAIREPTREYSETQGGKNNVDGEGEMSSSDSSARSDGVDNDNPGSSRGKEDIQSYPMNSEPRGVCLIINNVNFVANNVTNHDHGDRWGSDKDAENLKKLFKTTLKFHVVIMDDCKAEDMREILSQAANNKHNEKFNCFVCCILSHGTNGVVYGVDGRKITIKEMLEIFKISKCPTLKGKPKIFFLQACQGGRKELYVDGPDDEALASIKSIPESDGPTDNTGSIPSEPDFLLSYSAVPGYASYRSRNSGSFFISSLVELLEKHHSSFDLLGILTMVTNMVSQQKAQMKDQTYYQCPAPIYTLRKQIYWR